ncbi:unnamed protein product [Rotaria socialis]|uniref:Cysteine protease n=1 Tax=Rotaria socialis TaxID=392032 RepID=A0A820UJS4_9BILA|nr:unnamed protein product [Rotaria socialis]
MNSAALSFAASMFERNDTDNNTLSDIDAEICILGVTYKTPNDMHAITDDALSRFWFTYRNGFAPIGGPSGPTRDTGWGCMMRCGQMMFAEAYLRFFLPAGRYFRWRSKITDPIYWEILNMFIDKRHSSYSIHQIVQMGDSEGKSVGQWFGPNTIAQVLRRIASNEFEKQIHVHVAMDNTLILDEIRKLCQISSNIPNLIKKSNDTQTLWKPLVIIIPLRLGLNDVNVEYIDQIKLCFRLPQTLGFIGGKPNHAHYFIGYLESDELLYLDPHVTQPHIDAMNSFDDSSYHCDKVNRMKFSGLDPSLALAFACKTENEFDDLISKLRQYLPVRPMFEICETNPFDVLAQKTGDHEEMKLEDLPGEIWFLILSYVSPLEAFYAFKKIKNTRINSIMTEMYLIRQVGDNYSSILNLSLAHASLSMYNFAMSDIIPYYSHMIHELILSNRQTPGEINDFLQKYSLTHDFTYLSCLRLIEPSPIELNIIVNDIQNVKMIDIQSKYMHSYDVNTIQTILYSKPTIDYCCLSQFHQNFISKDSYSFIQSLKIDSCDYLCFLSILNHFCLLEKLSINTLSMPRNVILSSNNLIENPLLIKDLKLRAFSIRFDYLLVLFPFFENIQRFSLSLVCDEGFDYVNSDKWQMIISNYWPLLTKFQFYSELWYLTSVDLDELYPHLLSFKNDSFWIERQIGFVADFYQDKNDLHLIFYSNPYPDEKFSNQWGHSIDIVSTSKDNINSSLVIENTYEHVSRLLLTVYDNKQMRYELDKISRYFPNVDTLTVRFEQHASSALFRLYIEKIINLDHIKHLVLDGKCHTMATLYELILCLSNMNKLTITNNQRILVKQLIQGRNERLLLLLRQRLQYFNLLYDGVMSYDTVEAIRYNFPHLKTFSACLPHFEDFRDAIPAFMQHMKLLQYLHIGLECDNDKKNFTTQDMYDWFRRHNILHEIKLSIDTYTNSIHIWL